jgi:hypothetical protein
MCLVACVRSLIDRAWGATAGTVKLLLPPRQSRGISLVIRELNDVRNAFAHSFFPEYRKRYAKDRTVRYKGKDIGSYEGLKQFVDNTSKVMRYLTTHYEGS